MTQVQHTTTLDSADSVVTPAIAGEALPREYVKQAAVSGRNLGLDVLRFAAVLLTLVRHMTPAPPAYLPDVLRIPMEVLVQGAGTGVDMFFVLSGFLVSGLLFREYRDRGDVSFPRFFVRRGLRIYPPFLVLIVIYGVMEHFATHSVTPARLLAELLFVQNYFQGLWNHTWSLAVEEHFYLAIGLLVAFLAHRKRLDRMPWVLAAVFIGCFALRVWRFDEDRIVMSGQSHFRFDALGFGVLIAWVHTFHPRRLDWVPAARVPLIAIGVLLVVPCFVEALAGWHYLTWGLTASYLGHGCLVAAFALAPFPALPGGRFLAAIGAHSYSTYLWHMPIKRAYSLVRQHGIVEWPYFVELALFIVTSYAFGVLISRAVELPVLRIRERYFPARDR